MKGHSLSAQFGPVQPATQRQRPLFASHSALFWQSQFCRHPAPNLPGGHAAQPTDDDDIFLRLNFTVHHFL